MEHRVGGRSALEVFQDPHVAQLAQAACEGDRVEIRRLAQAGADLNALGAQNVTPLFWAITCENIAGIEELLKSGANARYVIPGSFSLVYMSSSYENSDILRTILKYGGDPNASTAGAGKSPAWPAILRGVEGDWTNYYLLIDAGLDISWRSDTGSTIPTELAALDQWDKILELLEREYRGDMKRLAQLTNLPDQGDARQSAAKHEVRSLLMSRGLLVSD